ncbi:hypothetical protein RB195_017102 [Necator americanus]|uniref:Uncharacterized protein n=1 Tax=Necator americanus TaxID=51031 RepID=A0ABR1C4N7_NECAM
MLNALEERDGTTTRWVDVFATRMDQLGAQLDTAQGPRQRGDIAKTLVNNKEFHLTTSCWLKTKKESEKEKPGIHSRIQLNLEIQLVEFFKYISPPPDRPGV